jgi:hypothetical protein
VSCALADSHVVGMSLCASLVHPLARARGADAGATQETARIEDLASPAALQGVLRGFYPDIRDDDVVRVVYYSPLVALPPMAEGPKRHASEVLSILGCSAAALTAVEIVALAGGDLTRQNVNSALYQLVRQVRFVCFLSLPLSLSRAHTHIK